MNENYEFERIEDPNSGKVVTCLTALFLYPEDSNSAGVLFDHYVHKLECVSILSSQSFVSLLNLCISDQKIMYFSNYFIYS